MKRIFSTEAWYRRAGRSWDGLFAFFDGGWDAVRRSFTLLPGRRTFSFKARRHKPPLRFVPAYETLEDRIVPSISATAGPTLSAVESQTGTFQVATFTDSNPGNQSGSIAATIDWGDSNTTSGSVTYNSGSGSYTVNGTHDYAQEGTRTDTHATIRRQGSRTIRTE